ncbi:MAG: hypothetical protein ACOX7I_02990 [Oscillospiraceae bacterium]|jgi:hypothetical protein
MSPEQALAGIILCAVELLKAGKGEQDPPQDAVVNPSFSMERFQELRGRKTAPPRTAEEDSRDKKSLPRPAPEKEILKIIRQAAEERGNVETLREEASREVITLLEKSLEQSREAEPPGRRKPSFLELESPAGQDYLMPAPRTEASLHNNSMREISDFFQRDSRRYDSGFQRY